jgi:hypothetical protein
LRILTLRAVTLAALVGVASGAHGETSDRFTMSPVDGGFVRLDKETGAMSICTMGPKEPNQEAWSCRPIKDQELELREELDRLKAENADLNNEIRRLEETFLMDKHGGGSGSDKGAGAGPPGGLPPGGMPEFQLPSEDDVDQAVDYLERMIRKFRERFQDFGEKTDPDRAPRDYRAPAPGEGKGKTPENNGKSGGGNDRPSTPL